MKSNRSYYWATSREMQQRQCPIALKKKGFFLEYNPNIKMFRLNNKRGVPNHLFGYHRNKDILLKQALKTT